MKKNETASSAMLAGRRRVLGAIVVASAPGVVAGAASAATTPGPPGPGKAASPLPGGLLLHREGWLLAHSDR